MVLPMYGKPVREGPLLRLAMPLFCFVPAQQFERPRRERQGSLSPLATLSVLTRVKIDRTSGRAKGGKVLRPETSTPTG